MECQVRGRATSKDDETNPPQEEMEERKEQNFVIFRLNCCRFLCHSRDYVMQVSVSSRACLVIIAPCRSTTRVLRGLKLGLQHG